MATKTYNFKTPLLDIDGSGIIENENKLMLNDILALNIRNASITEEIVVKFFEWAIDLKTNGELNIDNEDKEKLKKFIISSTTLPVISKGRLIEILNK